MLHAMIQQYCQYNFIYFILAAIPYLIATTLGAPRKITNTIHICSAHSGLVKIYIYIYKDNFDQQNFVEFYFLSLFPLYLYNKPRHNLLRRKKTKKSPKKTPATVPETSTFFGTLILNTTEMPLHAFIPVGLGFDKHDIMSFTYTRHTQKHVCSDYT